MGTGYSYLFADLMTGEILDELPLVEVGFDLALGEPGSLRGTLSVSDPLVLARNPHRMTRPGRTAIYVDRDGVLLWGGVIWTARYQPGDRTLELQAADFLSFFEHRLVLGQEGAPLEFEAPPIRIAERLLERAAEAPGGDLGIQILSHTPAGPGPERSVTYRYADLKPVAEALTDLAEGEGGFEMTCTVAYGSDGRPERRLLLGRPRLGQPGTPHVWEFGANITDLSWPEDAAEMATSVFVKGAASGEQDALIATAVDDTAHQQGWPLLELSVSHSDLDDERMLAELARSELAARRRPVVLPELTVRADLDPVLGSYTVGDDARLVIDDPYLGNGAGFDGVTRIVGIDVTPGDDGGEEAVKLTVTPVEEST